MCVSPPPLFLTPSVFCLYTRLERQRIPDKPFFQSNIPAPKGKPGAPPYARSGKFSSHL